MFALTIPRGAIWRCLSTTLQQSFSMNSSKSIANTLGLDSGVGHQKWYPIQILVKGTRRTWKCLCLFTSFILQGKKNNHIFKLHLLTLTTLKTMSPALAVLHGIHYSNINPMTSIDITVHFSWHDPVAMLMFYVRRLNSMKLLRMTPGR